MRGATRYLRLIAAFCRYSLARELAFRGNFLVKLLVEVIWLTILLGFYALVFSKTDVVAEWKEWEYLFFVGCYFALEGVMETLFLENCSEFTELVRTGDLDFYLLRPIDEQFLISFRKLDWSTAPNVLMGGVVMVIALVKGDWEVDLTKLAAFVVLFVCGVVLAYSFMLLLTSASVYFIRNQSLFELWWLVTSLMRYPKEVFTGSWGSPMGLFFTFVVPLLLIVNVPARTMVKVLDWRMIGFTLLATAALVVLSRKFFRHALRRYRSASS
ncbi:MAG TPA: ABC-2 family transporter protein [Gemmataceae bacterium]|nr:ABC-2 family transporter protein [Gemmataceae bacterium]